MPTTQSTWSKSRPDCGLLSSLLSAHQWLVFDPVRLLCLLTQAAFAVGVVVVVIAFEPLHMTIALERHDVGGDTVEEPAVMADDHGAARELQQRVFQRPQRIDVEVVGRLVEQQQVGAGFQHLGQVHPVALAAG